MLDLIHLVWRCKFSCYILSLHSTGGSDDLGSLGSSDESDLKVETTVPTVPAGRVGSRGPAARVSGSSGPSHAVGKRAPSAKPGGALQDILSDDDF